MPAALAQIAHAPRSVRVKKQRLGGHPGLPGQARAPRLFGHAAIPCCLHMDQDAWQLQVDVPLAVRHPDAVICEDPPGLLRGLPGDHHERGSE